MTILRVCHEVETFAERVSLRDPLGPLIRVPAVVSVGSGKLSVAERRESGGLSGHMVAITPEQLRELADALENDGRSE